ncbi:hypothetical protein NPX13_g11390 [Xylaria arbuscula]|uniref:Clr5 domain-containing protein n=1 Tax=Xylaria arbuscula TaxID=114810 RepID=A0A9W8TGJ6_9PEZI|nr:hypothetical protein NPX13_g11390 [Xylaria arbuscula]
MPSNDWELHKDTIVCLFLLEKLSLKEVSDRMKEEYHFDQKKHQYEYHLKKWGIKKNLSRDVWRYIRHQVRKRKMLGKRTEITQFGMQLQPDKVHKELQRYTLIPTAKDFGRDVPSPTNPGLDLIRVVTPNPPDFHKGWPATLPWLRFIEGFQIDLIGVPHMDRLLKQAGSNSSRLGLQNPLALCTKINETSIGDVNKVA